MANRAPLNKPADHSRVDARARLLWEPEPAQSAEFLENRGLKLLDIEHLGEKLFSHLKRGDVAILGKPQIKRLAAIYGCNDDLVSRYALSRLAKKEPIREVWLEYITPHGDRGHSHRRDPTMPFYEWKPGDNLPDPLKLLDDLFELWGSHTGDAEIKACVSLEGTAQLFAATAYAADYHSEFTTAAIALSELFIRRFEGMVKLGKAYPINDWWETFPCGNWEFLCRAAMYTAKNGVKYTISMPVLWGFAPLLKDIPLVDTNGESASLKAVRERFAELLTGFTRREEAFQIWTPDLSKKESG